MLPCQSRLNAWASSSFSAMTIGGVEVTDNTIPILIVRLSETGCFISVNLKNISPKTYTVRTQESVHTIDCSSIYSDTVLALIVITRLLAD